MKRLFKMIFSAVCWLVLFARLTGSKSSRWIMLTLLLVPQFAVDAVPGGYAAKWDGKA